MFFLYFIILSSNFYTGSLLFSVENRTKSHYFYFWNLALLTLEISAISNFELSITSTYLILYTPLCIGFFPFLWEYFNRTKTRFMNYKTCLTLLECTQIHLQMGRSFTNSLGLALENLPPKNKLGLLIEKNVVLQQPKSRNCTIFSELEQDLTTLSQQNLGRKELLTFIYDKFTLNFDLEQKIQLSSTQYKTQSYVLILFWLSAFTRLFIQNELQKFQSIVLISLIMMALGLIIAKKLIVKTEFRI